MYTAQRTPFLLRLQAEMLAYNLSEQPAARLALTNSTQFSESAKRIGQAAESLSQFAIQLPERFAEERKEITRTLEQQHGKLQELVAGVDQAFISGERLSGSLNVTLTNLGSVMKQLRTGQTNKPPFNILDYAKAADEVDTMAKDLNTLILSVNQGMPGIRTLRQQTAADVQKVVDHTFWLSLVWLAVLLMGSILAGLLYRVLSRKFSRRDAVGPQS